MSDITAAQVDEIAQDIYRISTWVPGITEHGFTFNQFLLTGDQPFLFHTGSRRIRRVEPDAGGRPERPR